MNPESVFPGSSAIALRWQRQWALAGWLLVAIIFVGSLVPMPQPMTPQVPGADKFQHLLGYFLLTFWHGQLGLAPAEFLRRALAFVALGALIEVLQAQTGWRTGDLRDLAANVVGIVFGLVIGGTRSDWLQRTELRLELWAVRRGWVTARQQLRPEPAGE